jgi:uncharacterized protein YndB with AHSA1/START domain
LNGETGQPERVWRERGQVTRATLQYLRNISADRRTLPAPPKEAVVPDFEQSREIYAGADAVWRVVSDPGRLADWVPTARSSRPAGEDSVQLAGESHGHDYDLQSGFAADDAARRLSWDSPRHTGYQGTLEVAERGTSSVVTVRVTIPDIPSSAEAEITRGVGEALDKIAALTKS